MLDFTSIVQTLAPELWLAAAALTLVLLGAIIGDRFNSLSYKVSALVLLAASGLAFLHLEGGTAFDGLVKTNTFLNLAKVICFALAAVAVLISESFLKRHKITRYEYPVLMVLASLGMGVILSANDLMTLYLGIETLSLSSYVLAAFHRDSARSSEAGLKYFVLGALASGLLLYGASLVYGFTGTTSYEALALAGESIGAMFGMVLMITGLAFKISAAPMHVWTPDVYEGAPTPVVAFFASAPKLASLVVFANIMFTLFGSVIDQWQLILAILAGASMMVGALGGLTQTNVKRLLAYSSIANVGYALIAVAAGQALGAAALMTFAMIYAISSLGLFAGILAMRREGGMVESIQELGGLARRQPVLTLALTILILSVAGLPPFGGFFGKYEVLQAGMNADLVPLAILLVIASVISLGYYLRLLKIMWFDEPREAFERVDTGVLLAVLGSAIIAGIVFMVFIGQLGSSGLAGVAASGLMP
ncbi:NADH-quinone oxidoreductase subunit NuoN [Hyphomonas sp.]|uniref:NADH-quinone oxidoreductase subunit NuoN n=1 Tax=Hyphomonas sp. TaxID=87 RepID=UPI0039188FCE